MALSGRVCEAMRLNIVLAGGAPISAAGVVMPHMQTREERRKDATPRWEERRRLTRRLTRGQEVWAAWCANGITVSRPALGPTIRRALT